MNARQRRTALRLRINPPGYTAVSSPDASCTVNGRDCAMRQHKWQDGCRYVNCTAHSRKRGWDVIFVKK